MARKLGGKKESPRHFLTTILRSEKGEMNDRTHQALYEKEKGGTDSPPQVIHEKRIKFWEN